MIEMFMGNMQRQHRREPAVILGDIEAPAVRDFHRYPRPQLRQQQIAGGAEPGRNPALHPDPRDLVIFVGPGGAVTVTERVVVPVAPPLSVTVSRTVYVPGAA